MFEGLGGAAKDDTPVISMGKAVSPPGGRIEEPTLVNTERDADRGQNAIGTRSAMRASTKRPVSSMKAEIPSVVEQPLVL